MARTYRRWKYRTADRCPVTGKTSFRSTTAARAFVSSREHWHGPRARVYACPVCSWFHVTSKVTNWERDRSFA